MPDDAAPIARSVEVNRMVESRWLKCKVFPGMFSQERLVVIEEVPGLEITSIFVDASCVRAKGEPHSDRPLTGEVLVDASLGSDRANVMLPVQSAECGRLISVPIAVLAN